jgi:hypothetical protein
MKPVQFAIMAYDWVFARIVPAIAPEVWQQQAIAFKKGREVAKQMLDIANDLAKDADGNIDFEDLEKRFKDVFKINPVFSYHISEPMLALIKLAPENDLEFSKADTDSFLAYMRGTTTTIEVKL